MAVKPSRKYDEGTEITYFMNEVAEPGVCVVFGASSSGDGDGYDDALATVSLPASGDSYQAVGMLLTNVVDIDESKYARNEHRNEVAVGGAVTILTHGWAITNMIAEGVDPKSGDPAYYAEDGLWTNVEDSAGRAGTFMTGKDSDGYAKIAVNTLV